MSSADALPAFPLKGKLAIVTGASRGIGFGIAYELARRGADLCVTYVSDRSKSTIAELQDKIRKLPNSPSVTALQVNLSTLNAAQEVIAHLKGQRKGDLTIDILVNNAGVEANGRVGDLTVEDYNTVFDLNVRGVFLMTQAVVPFLPPKGRIINISSIGARAKFGNVSLYIASKAAVEGFTRSWAADLGENGTTVNAVAPGPVPSDMLNRFPAEMIEGQKQATPVEKRLGSVEEIANIVAWLASPEASWVTGQTISASGGFRNVLVGILHSR
ncbi:dehydrogenase [Penicillium chermesinum]|nr:dehydrogenase [Penicillium chermesinum]